MDFLMNRRSRAALGMLGILGASPALVHGSASAQTSNPGPSAAPIAAAPAGHASSRAEHQLQTLHKALSITAAQEKSWEDFAQVLRDNAAATDQAYEEMKKPESATNALTRFKAYEQVQTVQADNLKKLDPVFTALYQSLSDEQKKAADRLFEQNAKAAAQRFAHRH